MDLVVAVIASQGLVDALAINRVIAGEEGRSDGRGVVEVQMLDRAVEVGGFHVAPVDLERYVLDVSGQLAVMNVDVAPEGQRHVNRSVDLERKFRDMKLALAVLQILQADA